MMQATLSTQIGQVTCVQPQVPSAFGTHAGPATVLPSGQMKLALAGRGVGHWSMAQIGGGGGQVVMRQPQTPVWSRRQIGPATVVPSEQICDGAPGAGPHSAAGQGPVGGGLQAQVGQPWASRTLP